MKSITIQLIACTWLISTGSFAQDSEITEFVDARYSETANLAKTLW